MLVVDNSPPLAVSRIGQGVPLLFLHGWGMHRAVWESTVGALWAGAAQAYQICLVDLPGYGDSPSLEPYTVPAIVAALRQTFAAELAQSPLNLVGWSWGGQIAMAWAAEHPGEIQKLALIATSPRWLMGDDWEHGIPALHLERFHDELVVSYATTIQRFLHLQVLGSDAGRATLATLKTSLLHQTPPDPQALAQGLRLLQTGDYRALAAQLNMPCLIISGGQDRLASWRAGTWLARSIGNADWQYLETAGHAPFLSHPEEFVARLLTFLQNP